MSSRIGVECWCDFGANLVQHFMLRYSRYSRYRTKSHDKAMISHVFSRYSRYNGIAKTPRDKYPFGIIYRKKLCSGRAFCVLYGGSICKKMSRPIYFSPFLWYNTTNR